MPPDRFDTERRPCNRGRQTIATGIHAMTDTAYATRLPDPDTRADVYAGVNSALERTQYQAWPGWSTWC